MGFLNGGYLNRAGGLAAEIDLQGGGLSRRHLIRKVYERVKRMSPEERARFVVGAKRIWEDLPEEQRRRLQLMEEMQPTDPRGLSGDEGLGWVGAVVGAAIQVGGAAYMAYEQKESMKDERKAAEKQAKKQREHEMAMLEKEMAMLDTGAPAGAQVAQRGGVAKAGGIPGLTSPGGGNNTMLIAGGILLMGGLMMVMMMSGGKKAA